MVPLTGCVTSMFHTYIWLMSRFPFTETLKYSESHESRRRNVKEIVDGLPSLPLKSNVFWVDGMAPTPYGPIYKPYGPAAVMGLDHPAAPSLKSSEASTLLAR